MTNDEKTIRVLTGLIKTARKENTAFQFPVWSLPTGAAAGAGIGGLGTVAVLDGGREIPDLVYNKRVARGMGKGALIGAGALGLLSLLRNANKTLRARAAGN